MKKDFQKWHNKKAHKAKTAHCGAVFAVYLPPGRLLPNFISGLGAREALLGLAKFGVDFLKHSAILLQKSELWPQFGWEQKYIQI